MRDWTQPVELIEGPRIRSRTATLPGTPQRVRVFRERDSRRSNPPLAPAVEQMASGALLCCEVGKPLAVQTAEGLVWETVTPVQDIEERSGCTEVKTGHSVYRVRVG